MMTRYESRRYGMAAIAFGLAGAAIYGLMTTLTLAHIEALSGQVAFDMRPFGYNPQQAVQLLDGLGEEGRIYYLTRQIPLDTVYPALLAMTLVSAICWFGRSRPNCKLVRFGIAFSFGAALFDYAENIGIATMLLNWPNLPDALVYATSATSIAKSCLTTAAVLVAIVSGVTWACRPKDAIIPTQKSEAAARTYDADYLEIDSAGHDIMLDIAAIEAADVVAAWVKRI